MSIFKRATFWLSVASLFICTTDYYGGDEKHIPLFLFNPFLNSVLYKQPFSNWIMNANHEVLFTAYLIHFASYFVGGVVIDVGLMLFRKVGDNLK